MMGHCMISSCYPQVLPRGRLGLGGGGRGPADPHADQRAAAGGGPHHRPRHQHQAGPRPGPRDGAAGGGGGGVLGPGRGPPHHAPRQPTLAQTLRLHRVAGGGPRPPLHLLRPPGAPGHHQLLPGAGPGGQHGAGQPRRHDRAVLQEAAAPPGGCPQLLDRAQPQPGLGGAALGAALGRLEAGAAGGGGRGQPGRADLAAAEAGLRVPPAAPRHPPHAAVHAPGPRPQQAEARGAAAGGHPRQAEEPLRAGAGGRGRAGRRVPAGPAALRRHHRPGGQRRGGEPRAGAAAGAGPRLQRGQLHGGQGVPGAGLDPGPPPLRGGGGLLRPGARHLPDPGLALAQAAAGGRPRRGRHLQLQGVPLQERQVGHHVY